MEPSEFIKESRNIHQNIRAMIRGIRLVYVKAPDESEMKALGEKVNHKWRSFKTRERWNRGKGRVYGWTNQQDSELPREERLIYQENEAASEVGCGSLERFDTSKKERPEWVTIISKWCEEFYTDIFRKMEGNLQLTSVEDDVRLELKKFKNVTADKFLSQIEKSLGQEADIKISKPEISIIWKDISEINTKEEIRRTLEKENS